MLRVGLSCINFFCKECYFIVELLFFAYRFAWLFCGLSIVVSFCVLFFKSKLYSSVLPTCILWQVWVLKYRLLWCGGTSWLAFFLFFPFHIYFWFCLFGHTQLPLLLLVGFGFAVCCFAVAAAFNSVACCRLIGSWFACNYFCGLIYLNDCVFGLKIIDLFPYSSPSK